MPRTLVVTNDFPPRPGGIQSYLHALASRMPAHELLVYAPAWQSHPEFDADQPFDVVREKTSVLLPTPGVARRAAKLAHDGGAHASEGNAAESGVLRAHVGFMRALLRLILLERLG